MPWLRWSWRTLTSMRVALALLALFALASVPGSLLPQRSASGNPDAARRWVENNEIGPLLDRLGFFNVYSSPWFAAVYILLLVSMTGCVLPRCRTLWRAARSEPVAAPRNLRRLEEHRVSRRADADADAVRAAAADHLRRRRFRVVVRDGAVSAEKGYLREVGNLGFHLSLLVLLIGMAIGTLFGYEGRVIVAEGKSFANTYSAYDEIFPGPLVDRGRFEPFSLVLDDFSATFEPRGPARGSPRDFLAELTVTEGDAAPRQDEIKVNAPLQVGLTKVFLTGNGYAPRVTVRDGAGQEVLSDTVVFLPLDGNLTSEGVVKAPDALPEQLGFQGLFLPTAAIDPQTGPYSKFPQPVDPQLFLTAWTGDLGMDRAQSVFTLDTSGMEQVQVDGQPLSAALRPGQTLTLPDGLGSITFDGVARFANFQIAYDPGRSVSLVAAVLLLAGLTVSLLVPRRRVWVRVDQTGDGVDVEVATQVLSRRSVSVEDVDALLEALPGSPAGAGSDDHDRRSDPDRRPTTP